MLYKVRTAIGTMLRDGRCRREFATTRITDCSVDFFKGLRTDAATLDPEEIELKAYELR